MNEQGQFSLIFLQGPELPTLGGSDDTLPRAFWIPEAALTHMEWKHPTIHYAYTAGSSQKLVLLLKDEPYFRKD